MKVRKLRSFRPSVVVDGSCLGRAEGECQSQAAQPENGVRSEA